MVLMLIILEGTCFRSKVTKNRLDLMNVVSMLVSEAMEMLQL